MPRFGELPLDAEFVMLDHLGDEVKFRKTNMLGISGMVCNAEQMPEDGKGNPKPCWVPLDKDVVVHE